MWNNLKALKTCCLSLLIREAREYTQMRACAAWIVLMFRDSASRQFGSGHRPSVPILVLRICPLAGCGTKSWHCLIPALVSFREDSLSMCGTFSPLSSCDSGFGDIYRMFMPVMLRGHWPGLVLPLFLCESLLPDWAALARVPVE